MRPDIVEGGTFPDYKLIGHDRRHHQLSEVQGRDPMILILSRGHYCPKDFQQHRLMVDFHQQVDVAYTKLVTISTSTISETDEWRRSLGAHWLFLVDPRRTVQKDLEIQEYTDPKHDPMIPHTLVLAPGLIIHRIYNGYWFWGRPSPYELWLDLRDLSRIIRPDWDLDDPDIRADWTRGRGMHHPYSTR
jgi:peroxiredoxin